MVNGSKLDRVYWKWVIFVSVLSLVLIVLGILSAIYGTPQGFRIIWSPAFSIVVGVLLALAVVVMTYFKKKS